MSADISLIHPNLSPGFFEKLIVKQDEALFGGPPGGSMTETTNEVVPVAEGLTVESLIKLKHELGLDRPRIVEWATPDFHRLTRALIGDTWYVRPNSLAPPNRRAFYGVPVVFDGELDPDVLIEARDQHGNSLGRVMAS